LDKSIVTDITGFLCQLNNHISTPKKISDQPSNTGKQAINFEILYDSPIHGNLIIFVPSDKVIANTTRCSGYQNPKTIRHESK